MRQESYIRTLAIAGSDSGGGAGIQADLKTFSAFGCYGMSVITAMTAQNTCGVTAIQKADETFVAQQLDAVLGDIGVDAVKIGMLFSAGIVQAVEAKLKAYNVKNIVLDPVMIAKSGDSLLQKDAADALVKLLFPIATLVTPNLYETRELTGLQIESESEMREAAAILFDKGAENVLIKGGHSVIEPAVDHLFCKKDNSNKRHRFPGRWVDTVNTHGTGCTYSSAIAACLANGHGLSESIRISKRYIGRAIEAGARYRLGSGHGPVLHFHENWK